MLGTDVKIGGALGKLGDTVVLPLSQQGQTDHQVVAFQISGTWSGTVTFECSLDTVTPTNWTALNVNHVGNTGLVSTATANGLWRAGVGGLAQIRLRMSSYSSGTANVVLTTADGTQVRVMLILQ
jgi:hypothetical protein